MQGWVVAGNGGTIAGGGGVVDAVRRHSKCRKWTEGQTGACSGRDPEGALGVTRQRCGQTISRNWRKQ